MMSHLRCVWDRLLSSCCSLSFALRLLSELDRAFISGIGWESMVWYGIRGDEEITDCISWVEAMDVGLLLWWFFFGRV